MSVPLPNLVLSVVENAERVAVAKRMAPLLAQGSDEFDQMANLAATRFDVPYASISVVDETVQHSLAMFGGLDAQFEITSSFCAHAIADTEQPIFVIPDCTLDPRFQNHPLVRDLDNPIRFYAAAPYKVDGHRIGTVYVVDTKLRHDVPDESLEALSKIADLVSSFIELKIGLEDYRKTDRSRANMQHRFELATCASGMATWIWDLRTDEVDAGQELRNLFGITHARPLKARDILQAVHLDDVSEVDHALSLTQSEGRSYEAEFRLANSPDVWIAGHGSALEWSEEGECLTIAGINYDISDQKRDEKRTRLLLRELNHRVKNTLAMLQSIASQTLRNAKSPEEFKTAFSGRIRSIALAHTHLSDREWGEVGLKRLLEDQVMLYANEPDRQVIVEGEMPKLGPEESLALGMVMHELASNALKYGALSRKEGTVTLSVDVDNDPNEKTSPPLLHIKWIERGGPQVIEPDRQGFGTVMIRRSLDKIIGSNVTLDFPPDGVKAAICMPLRKI